MKKVYILLCVAAFALLGAQVFASPPIEPPVEGFMIESTTEAVGVGDMTENEQFNWTYFEGWGKGVFYFNAYHPATCCGVYKGGPCCPEGLFNNFQGYVVSELGFTEGAEIAYEQTFEAKDGSVEFQKTFVAKSDPEPGDNNLVVNKKIEFEALDPAVGYAKHTEKVGLSVISMGAPDTTGNPATGLLTLCPWASNGSGSTGGGYPPTNEGIAAGSSFQVTKLVGFESKSVVNSSINPALSYDVTAAIEGKMSAGFVVDLWEGPKDYVWGPYRARDYCVDCVTCLCLPQSTHRVDQMDGTYLIVPNDCFILPGVYGMPPLASRLHYQEHASVEGTWTFSKQVRYESTLPGAPAAGTFPFNQVP